MEKQNESLVKTKNALDSISSRLQVNSESLKKTLKATVCKDFKTKDGRYRAITDEEFVSFIVVSNTYKLNPLTKEIYAYPDVQGGGIIPIVSTDGWNKLMTTHPDYKTHYYVYAENRITMKLAKPCPEWIEIHIVKKDESEVVVREYLDECFRELPYKSPWQTHTKRMLRHKTKIQGAREAFGFGGIYDEDEAERVIEGKVIEAEYQSKGKPAVEMPKAKEVKEPNSPLAKVKTSDLIDSSNFITKEQQEKIVVLCKKEGVSEEELELYLEVHSGTKLKSGILKDDFNTVCEWIETPGSK